MSQSREVRNPSRWRIDELARLAGVTVDTIRYYQREGILPRPLRRGRSRYYGPDHLLRLEQIRALQDRRFSLAAIRAVVDAEHPGLIDALFADADPGYDLDELEARSGLDEDLIARLAGTGLLSDPERLGRSGYDGADVAALTAVGELIERGLPAEVVIAITGIYARYVAAMQREVVELMSTGRGLDLDQDELDEIQRVITQNLAEALPFVERIINHLHHRTLQQVTLEQIRAEATDHNGGDDGSGGDEDGGGDGGDGGAGRPD